MPADAEPTPEAENSYERDIERLTQALERSEQRTETFAKLATRDFEDTRTLDQRIAEVQGELEDVPRRGHADVTTATGGTYSYDYILEADLMKAIRPLLAKHGVATYYSDRIVNAGATTIVEVTIRFRANGDEIVCTAEGVGTDKGDKAANKAKTSAVRYLLWKMFLQPSDEDPEQENVTVAEAEQAQATRQRATTPAARRQGQPDTRTRLLETLTRRSIELDEVQGHPAGRTLDRLPEIARTAFPAAGDYPNGLTDAQLVEIGKALAQHLTLERAAAENETDYVPTEFALEVDA